jgi:hypothetical protein
MTSPFTVAIPGMGVAVGGAGVEVGISGVGVLEVPKGSEQAERRKVSRKIVVMSFWVRGKFIARIIPESKTRFLEETWFLLRAV